MMYNPSNDNFNPKPVRPRPATPMDLMNYANQVIAVNERWLKRNWVTEEQRMGYHNQISQCKKIKIIALEYMTEGKKPDEIVMK